MMTNLSVGYEKSLGVIKRTPVVKEVERYRVKPVLDRLLQSGRRDTVMLQHMTVKEFKDGLAELEASKTNPYSAVNRFGFMGKYQLSRYYVDTYAKVHPDTFLLSPSIQERTMNKLCALYLAEIHRRGWDTLYVNTVIDSINVTVEGLMAGYHLYPRALKHWLESSGRINGVDGNKVTVSTYVLRFKHGSSDVWAGDKAGSISSNEYDSGSISDSEVHLYNHR